MHTKEPWKVSGTQNIVAGGKYVFAIDVKPEDARRIVACVNACAGIPTEWLETFATDKDCDPEILEPVIGFLKRQRDELLDALKHIECEPINAEYMARAAISKCEAAE